MAKNVDIDELRQRFGTFDEPIDQSSSKGETVRGLFDEDPARRKALNDAYKLVSAKTYTEFEVRSKLRAKEHASSVIDGVIVTLREAHIVDDSAYADSFIRSRVGRGHGPRRIQQDLAKRGIRGEQVADLLNEQAADGAIDDAALEAARKKARRLDLTDPKHKAKLLRFLAGRGYSSSQRYAALNQIEHERSAK